MATKPLTSEAIAITEKKMDMALEDIIKLSKNTKTKPKKQRRVPSKNQKSSNNLAQDKSMKVKRFMDTRSSLRQGFLAQRRSNFQGNQFPLATEVARKAAAAPLRNRAFGRNRVANWNKARSGAPPVQRRAPNGDFAAKSPRQQQQANAVPKPRSQTLDSLFANMKEQRMRILSRQNNAPLPRNGGGSRIPPWARGRVGN
ncbi:uncharacterized protein LOC132176327 [Corylus avellana]|uniref:uncharacterized protein LOC132175313 n=1 Tax=Corylus avellana TaxID=13451 RepID=UPI00286BD4A7|nr:uncharacterized protein LOC132175313 [Corylus avellana]XP_059444485.1 uncharacterized protein LOC132176327 [Corylus avellana]